MRVRRNITLGIWAVVGILILLLFLDIRPKKPKSEEQVRLDIGTFLDQLKEESNRYFSLFDTVHFNSALAEEAYGLKKKNWYLVVAENKKAVFWNSNKFGLDSNVYEHQDFPAFYSFGDDFYIVFKQEGAYLAYRLANDGQLTDDLVHFYPQLESCEHIVQGERPKLSNMDVLEFQHQESHHSNAWILFNSLFIILLLLFFRYLKHGKINVAIAISALLLILDILIHFSLKETKLSISALYQPNIYASSNLLNSLGMLLNHTMVVIPVLFLYRYWIKNSKRKLWRAFISAGLAFFATDLVLGLVKGLVLDSNISFNFQDLYGITAYTFIAITVVGLMFFAFITFILSTSIKDIFKDRIGQIPIGFALAFFIAFQIFDGHRSFVSLLLPIGITYAILVIHSLFKQTRLRVLALFFFTILVSSILVLKSDLVREKRYLSLYADKLVANQDLRAEYILKSFEDQLAEEFLIPIDYTNFGERKDVFENRIKRLYFSNYLEKYELRLISFDSTGVNINANTLFSYEDLDKVYNENTKRTVSNYFYQINNPTLISGYIAKYENCDLNGHYGATFILLQPRLIQSDFLYPEAFANQQRRELVNMDDYSYAIYFNKRLISQRGSFNYSLDHPPEHEKDPFGLHFGDYYHYHFTDIDQFEVILSKKVNVLTSWLSTFTFCFLFLIPLTLVLIFVAYVYDPDDSSFMLLKGKFLSTRIQVSLTLILLLGLLLSVYIIINYISSNYNTNLQKDLVNNVKNISARFQNKVDLEQKLNEEEQRQLMLNEESSAYKVDLNLFNSAGQLLTTTKPNLVQEEVVARFMNPKAYTAMNVVKSSQLLLMEELEGTEYLSAYVPLFNGKNQVIGYLNIPYFAKNEELNKQISTVIVNVINIYFLLMLGGILVALFISKRISKPLLLIRQRFAETELGARNELIIYNRDDEIGQLVKQYNKMVLELEQSVKRLAETEREGAWREMAKQVAHEIKNPLTPMKLSIQHLQRAYERGGDKLDDLFARTSKLLIEQIDSLSNMASEFSSFAKMPDDQYEVFNLSQALEDTVELFKRTENVEWQVDIERNVLVFADLEQIKRVFNNLIKNGIQAIPVEKNGKISVELRSAGSVVICKVGDNGTGINKDDAYNVFVPNFSTKTSGMGLGLAISKKIVETAKGSINFKTELNKGTTFTVILPIHHEKES